MLTTAENVVGAKIGFNDRFFRELEFFMRKRSKRYDKESKLVTEVPVSLKDAVEKIKTSQPHPSGLQGPL